MISWDFGIMYWRTAGPLVSELALRDLLYAWGEGIHASSADVSHYRRASLGGEDHKRYSCEFLRDCITRAYFDLLS